MKLKLWQAILIGCDRREQGFGEFNQISRDGDVRTCALGAAYEGTFGEIAEPSKAYERLRMTYPILERRIGSEDLLDLIVDLNDLSRWPREKIAIEFVKPIEEVMEDEVNP
jgi:hypothetical protein